MGDRDRIESYLGWREASTSTRIEPSPFGTALFNDDFPSYWDGNFLRVDRPGDATAEQLIEEADRLFEGFGHRTIVVPDESAGARWAATFGRDGWEVDRLCSWHDGERPTEGRTCRWRSPRSTTFLRSCWRRTSPATAG